ncbi:MAG: short chain dehydrogenase [Rhizobacter sp.]|nr:short chain dehydrogenase [Rhizobacter sp.]
MRILIVGGSGTIGRAVAEVLARQHVVIAASRQSGSVQVDISDPESIRRMYQAVGKVDAVVCAAGQARFASLQRLSDEDFAFSLHNKLMGQVNLVRYGVDNVNDGGSLTLTSGVLAQRPIPGSAAISLVNAAIEGFARAAALEATRGIRVNVVSPPWVAETLLAMNMDPAGGRPAAEVALAYARAVTESETGATLTP